jgi:hypothetical protein
VARTTVGEFVLELALHVTIHAHAHRTELLPADRVKTMTDCPMAVAAMHIHSHSMREFVVRCSQPILGKDIRQIAVTGQTCAKVPHTGIDDDGFVYALDVPVRFVAVMARHAVYPAVSLIIR